VTQCGKTCVH